MQKTKGISLIVLVITIIVMIILAGAIVVTLNNSGIIGEASNAVSATNLNLVKELANTAWAEAYLNNVDDYQEAVVDYLKKGLGDDIQEHYTIVANKKGVTVGTGWIQTDELTVMRKNEVINIGDVVNYTDKAGENDAQAYNGEWQVLGAEDGKLLLLSTNSVSKYELNPEKTTQGGKDAYANAEKTLNDLCAPYGTGTGAVGARSININDINKIIEYDPTHYDGGTAEVYGNISTYYWDSDKQPYFSATNGHKANLRNEHDSFIWYDGESWQSAARDTSASDESKKVITSTTNKQAICKNTFYSYDSTELANLRNRNETVYNMVTFQSSSNHAYWLASTYIKTGDTTVQFGIFTVVGTTVAKRVLVYSDGKSNSVASQKVRAVIELAPTVELDSVSEGVWNIL